MIFLKKLNYKNNQNLFFFIICKIKILIKLLVIFFFSVFTIPILLIIYLISPIYLVRFKNLRSDRIGHFAANTELYLLEKKFKINTPSQKYIDLVFCEHICNKQLLKMWKRKILILPTFILYNFYVTNKFFSKFFNFVIKHEAKDTSSDRDINNLLESNESNLQFLKKEEQSGEAFLEKLNLKKNDKFVMLGVRDNTYLENRYPNQDWTYHDVRNQNLDNFILAIDEIVKRGYYVIRMGGTSSSKKLNYNHPKVIDYTHSKLRNEFLDIYLGAKCHFCISTGFGLDAIPRMFRRPIVSILLAPIDIHTELSSQITILRPYYSLRKKKNLTLDEMMDINIATIMNGYEFNLSGLKVLENTPEEIRDVTIEMIDRLEGKWMKKPNDELIQKRFWLKFEEMHNLFIEKTGKKAHGTLKGRIGANYLRKHWLNYD